MLKSLPEFIARGINPNGLAPMNREDAMEEYRKLYSFDMEHVLTEAVDFIIEADRGSFVNMVYNAQSILLLCPPIVDYIKYSIAATSASESFPFYLYCWIANFVLLDWNFENGLRPASLIYDKIPKGRKHRINKAMKNLEKLKQYYASEYGFRYLTPTEFIELKDKGLSLDEILFGNDFDFSSSADSVISNHL